MQTKDISGLRAAAAVPAARPAAAQGAPAATPGRQLPARAAPVQRELGEGAAPRPVPCSAAASGRSAAARPQRLAEPASAAPAARPPAAWLAAPAARLTAAQAASPAWQPAHWASAAVTPAPSAPVATWSRGRARGRCLQRRWAFRWTRHGCRCPQPTPPLLRRSARPSAGPAAAAQAWAAVSQRRPQAHRLLPMSRLLPPRRGGSTGVHGCWAGAPRLAAPVPPPAAPPAAQHGAAGRGAIPGTRTGGSADLLASTTASAGARCLQDTPNAARLPAQPSSAAVAPVGTGSGSRAAPAHTAPDPAITQGEEKDGQLLVSNAPAVRCS